METTKNKLTLNESIFFDKLKNYINKSIYFYGSIQRDDYFCKLSDIDIDIFTDNVYSTLFLLQNFLNIGKKEFNKCLYKIDKKNIVIPGYKSKYIDKNNNFIVEISVYDEKYKKEILDEHNRTLNLPLYITFFLIFIKFLHYKLSVLPIYYYSKIKKQLLTYFYDGNKSEFIVLDI